MIGPDLVAAKKLADTLATLQDFSPFGADVSSLTARLTVALKMAAGICGCPSTVTLICTAPGLLPSLARAERAHIGETPQLAA